MPRPLADRLRPRAIDDVVGQDHLTGPGGVLRRMVEARRISSIILWGPPGCGKTTLARILADHTDLHFEQISAIFSGVADLRKVFDGAKLRRQQGRGTLLFVDEIHRFNKSQQDAFLPVVEDGTIVLIGATTENPSFELNAALMSRAQVVVLKRLDDAGIETLLQRAETEMGQSLKLDIPARDALKAMADGDGRYALTMAEQIFQQDDVLDVAKLSALVARRAPLYDKADEGHYNLISALHKAVRGSDPQAALYWFCRMLAGGEDPRFLARRIIRMANEDIGMADPQAMGVVLAAWDTYERLGSPEGELALAQALIYVATAPKSNAVYTAYKGAQRSAQESGSLMPPAHILNAPTALMKDIGYGTGYQYDHDTPEGFSGQNYFPDELPRQEFYHPVERGFEREVIKRLEYWQKLREKRVNNR
jgi:putative ATPase